jgi:hypothetical protein
MQYTVHAAEGVGLLLALHLLNKEAALPATALVGIDNHALIMGLQKYKHTNGQWAVDRARN